MHRAKSPSKSFRDVELTPRQIQILEMVFLGLLNKEIAKELGITERTVKYHLTVLFEKTATRGRTELLLWNQIYRR